MMNLGLADWVAQDVQAYQRKAMAFASDLPALAELRAGMRDRAQRSPLFDAPRFARHLEQALRDMWRQRCYAASEVGA
jgi:protein O-GlcNAc transferase